MKIIFLPGFKRSYKKRIQPKGTLILKTQARIDIFRDNPHHPILKNHELKGPMIGLRAFSVTGDMRIIYYIENEKAYFVDIGTHNQVYK